MSPKITEHIEIASPGRTSIYARLLPQAMRPAIPGGTQLGSLRGFNRYRRRRAFSISPPPPPDFGQYPPSRHNQNEPRDHGDNHGNQSRYAIRQHGARLAQRSPNL